MGMVDASYPPASSGYKSPAQIRAQRNRHLQSQGFQAKMAEEAMSEREVGHAIRVTEEKLEGLKAAMQKKGKQAEASSEGSDNGTGD